MKKIILASMISSLMLCTLKAQTPAPPRPNQSERPSQPESAPSGGTGAEGKVALVNTSQFQKGIDEVRIRLDALDQEFAPRKKELQTLGEEIKSLKNKIQTQGSTVSPQVRSQWAEDAADKEKNLKRKSEDYEALAQKRLSEVSQPVYEKIQKFLDSYCQQRGIALVMEAGAASQAGIIVWAVPAADITDDFIKEYNKANPSGAQKKD